MDNKLGLAGAFVAGIVVAKKWPTIKKVLVSLGTQMEKGVVKSYLIVKQSVSSTSSHFTKVAGEVSAGMKAGIKGVPTKINTHTAPQKT